MNPIIRSIIAVVAGLFIGGLVNMGIIMASGALIPPPEGVDPSKIETIIANIDKYQPIHFLMPFLAHAMGTLVGAAIAYYLAVENKMRGAIVIGVFFLVGGIMAVRMIPAPLWFDVLDLVGAYIPMAWLGSKIAGRLQG
jgi:hypothetical protein